MEKYKVTVNQLKAILDDIINQGHGEDIIALKIDMANQKSMVLPILNVFGGNLNFENGVSIDESREGFVFIDAAAFLPENFWEEQFNVN